MSARLKHCVELPGRQAQLAYLFDLMSLRPSGLSEEEFYAFGKAWKEVELLNGDFLLRAQEPPANWTWSKNHATCQMLGTCDANGDLSIPKERFVAFYDRALESLEDHDFAMGCALGLLAIDVRQYAEADRLLGDTGELPSERRDYMVALVKALPLSGVGRK